MKLTRKLIKDEKGKVKNPLLFVEILGCMYTVLGRDIRGFRKGVK